MEKNHRLVSERRSRPPLRGPREGPPPRG
jgi:hypothetical protein